MAHALTPVLIAASSGVVCEVVSLHWAHQILMILCALLIVKTSSNSMVISLLLFCFILPPGAECAQNQSSATLCIARQTTFD